MTLIEKLELSLLGIISFDSEELRAKYKEKIEQFKLLEKEQKMYSEEEVVQLLDALWDELDIWYNKESDEQFNLIRWFYDSKQFKNK